MPASNAPGLAHFPTERFPADQLPSSVLDDLPIFGTANQAAPASPPLDAPGFSHLPVELFPADDFPSVAWNYLPFADLF